MPTLKFYNTLTRAKEVFVPGDKDNVRMYVCGPTVYDYAHIGNARPAIVFDVLYRLLRHTYGAEHVTYVRNITDVDDKINARALRDYPELPLNEAIRKVTEKTEKQYLADVAALGCLEPNVQPRATENISQMVEIIQKLLDNGNAYVATGGEGREVLFAVPSMEDYGQLSKRKQEDQQAGARIAVEAHKKNPSDFVLWKESAADEPGWSGAFKVGGEPVSIHGRPGWHIECSAMSKRYLGETFDIHGGGLDLIFPHHENEIAQSRCAHGTDVMANVWMHNGFLQVEGKKMSKSEGNFITIHELLDTEKFGGRKWAGPVVRLAMLKSHYREPIDWTVVNLKEAREDMCDFALALSSLATEMKGYYQEFLASAAESSDLEDNITIDEFAENFMRSQNVEIEQRFLSSLRDDLNTPVAIMALQDFAKKVSGDLGRSLVLLHTLRTFGIMKFSQISLFDHSYLFDPDVEDETFFEKFRNVSEEVKVMHANNAPINSSSFESLFGGSIKILEISPGLLSFNLVDEETSRKNIEKLIERRLEYIKAKNWPEADRIRDELLAKGIQLKDGKDPETGERTTTWEMKR
ncbi:cysteine--tRNA ligase [Rhizobium sp. L1K21]|uniref:cysteine--tRNA ligase n=1 Tax=Rhizobium sp. L1K21 TaxID=2954933 RepID=UPI0020927CB9|nr:cysteine--tRNA ligase [Rhizobium sp. L1K21]MCO6186569.1 cysteine--tRNA ligase [Rhizobium sp. L1K21]